MDAIVPELAKTVIRFRVRFCETDLMGIVHHAAYLTYFEAGRVEWLRRRGLTYSEWAARGVHLPVVDARARYRAPARFDEEIEVLTALVELRSASMRFEYRIAGPSGALLCEGSTRLACVDADHALTRIPDEMRRVLALP